MLYFKRVMQYLQGRGTQGHVEGESPVVSLKCVVHYLADSKYSDFSYIA